MISLGNGNALVPIVLLGWLPAIFIFFALFPPRRAALVAFLGGWMFLPATGFTIQYFPEYNKSSATCIGIFAATLIFDTGRFSRLRPHWVDLFLFMLVTAPLFASLSNGLGLYDGLSAMNSAITAWVFPYLVGRLYFNDLRSMRALVEALFVAGLIYVPFCLWEMRMSPNLHHYIYGFHPSPFIQALRAGSYRPVVFMRHGLMTSMFMAMATLSGFALWFSNPRKTYYSVPMYVVGFVGLGLTTVLSQSAGALVLLMAGMASILFIRYARNALPVVAIVAFSVGYVVIRGGGLWDGMELVDMARLVFGQDRAGSLETRIVNESALAAKARVRPLVGWGGWGRSRIKDQYGRDMSITDGLWIIIFGTTGAMGLTGFLGTMLIPALLLVKRVPPRFWMHPMAAPTTAAALIVCLWVVDCIVNSMFNPIYIVAAGGLAGFRKVRAVQPQAVPRRKPVARADGSRPAHSL